MIAWHKRYKIVTDTVGKFSQYEIYSSINIAPRGQPFEPRLEAVGYIQDDFGGEEFAAEHARAMIDCSFNTPILAEILKLPKYV